MTDAYARKHREFYSQGFTVLESVLADPNITAKRILESHQLTPVFKPEPFTLIPGGKGSLKWRTLDRFQLDTVAPEVGELYFRLLTTLKEVIGSDIVQSKDSRSA